MSSVNFAMPDFCSLISDLRLFTLPDQRCPRSFGRKSGSGECWQGPVKAADLAQDDLPRAPSGDRFRSCSLRSG